MIIKNGKEKDIEKYLKNEKMLVSVYAEYCKSCEMMAPILEEVSKELTVLKLNVDSNQEFVTKKQIGGTPAHFFYKNGEEIGRKDGFITKEIIFEVFK